MKSKFSKKILFGLVLSVVSISIQAAPFWITGRITRTLAQANVYGGCMVKLNTPIPAGNSCNAGFISLDCQGSGERKYTSALMAFALDKRVSIYVNDALRHNGYCVGIRVDVLQN